MKPTVIEATTIPDAWFQCLYTLIDESRKPDGAARRYTVDTGSNSTVTVLSASIVTVLVVVVKLSSSVPLQLFT